MVLYSPLTVGKKQSVLPIDSQSHWFCMLTWTQTEVSAVCWMDSQSNNNSLSFSLCSLSLWIFFTFFLPVFFFLPLSILASFSPFMISLALAVFQLLTDVCGALYLSAFLFTPCCSSSSSVTTSLLSLPPLSLFLCLAFFRSLSADCRCAQPLRLSFQTITDQFFSHPLSLYPPFNHDSWLKINP